MYSQEFLSNFVFMRKPLEKLILILLFVALWSCNEQPTATGTLMDLTPQDASVVLKITDWKNFQENIASNSLISQYNKSHQNIFIPEKSSFLKHLKPNSQSLLSFNNVNDSTSVYTFITKQNKELFQPDSIKNKTIETLKINERAIQRITIDKETAYSATIDSIFVVSSSQQLLMDILNGKTEQDETFKKVYQLPNESKLTALIRENNVQISDSTDVNFASWTALNISLEPKSFIGHGIILATDSIPQLLSVFKNQIPQQNHVSSIVPMNALGAFSFTFNDAESIQKNLSLYRNDKESLKPTGIFDSTSEVGVIEMISGSAVFIKSIDASLTTDALARYVTTHTSFREIEIKKFSEPSLFKKAFYPLITTSSSHFVFQLDDFFVFTDTEANAQEIIGAFQNNSTLVNTSYFDQTASDISSSSSLLILKMQGEFSESIARFFNKRTDPSLKKLDFKKYPLMALQFSYDRNFAHVLLSCREFGGKTISAPKGVSEKFSLDLKSTILGNPKIFDSGKGINVVVQDVANKLYFISDEGKILWTKEIGSPILGEIKQVDIFGNGNKQLAFATKNSVYILDREGKDAQAFPLKFKDDITQPLSVFDYDNNHKYRFVVVQDKQVLLYDKNGKTVKGFDFKKAKSSITQSPTHIRMGNKDYILIAEEEGKLNILSRVGKPRVKVSKTFKFSDIPITSEDKSFVVITKDNTKEQISEKGEVTSQKLDVSVNYWFTTMGSLKATLDNNLLRVNGKLAELPIGLYSNPEVFSIDRKTYIGITETQEKKVYLFDKNANLMDGFPVYGSSTPSMDSGSLVVKGESNNIILYTTN